LEIESIFFFEKDRKNGSSDNSIAMFASRIKRETHLLEQSPRVKSHHLDGLRLKIELSRIPLSIEWDLDPKFPSINKNHHISLTSGGATVTLERLLEHLDVQKSIILSTIKSKEWIPVWRIANILEELENVLSDSIDDLPALFQEISAKQPASVQSHIAPTEDLREQVPDSSPADRIDWRGLTECQPGHDGSVVYDVRKQGVLLARHFLDSKIDPTGWWVSEKYDGYRAIWNGQHFMSRYGNPFVAPEWFTALMPPGVALDGELWSGRGNFRQCGLFHKKTPVDREWIEQKVLYQTYDLLGAADLPFEERMALLKRVVATRCRCPPVVIDLGTETATVTCPLIYTEQQRVRSHQHLIDLFNRLVKEGAEGVMLRQPGSLYEPRRSATLLKLKQFRDAECQVVGYVHDQQGRLESFTCQQDHDGQKVTFSLPGLPKEVKETHLSTHPLGTSVTYTYSSLLGGIPNRPMYLRKYDP
jgi:DNA ligase-1